MPEITPQNPRGAGRKPTPEGPRTFKLQIMLNQAEWLAYKALGTTKTRELLIKNGAP